MNIISNTNTPAWKKIWQDTICKHKFCILHENKFRHPVDGREGNFLAIDICDSVQIVAETNDNKILLVQQFRFGNESLSLELPAGRMEKGENAITCAERELLEETGYAGQNAQIIATLYPNPAIQVNKTYVVGIEKCSQISKPHFDEMEDLATIVVSRDELVSLAKAGEIGNCLTLSAMAKFLL